MAINIIEAAKVAKAKTNDKRWQNAIDKAVAGVTSGQWIVTELHDGIMVTTDSGETYRVNGHCTCRAAQLGQPCKHIALRRLLEIAATETAPEPKVEAKLAPVRVPSRITKSIEQNHNGQRLNVYRVDGWSI
jgi:hypothetical protein